MLVQLALHLAMHLAAQLAAQLADAQLALQARGADRESARRLRARLLLRRAGLRARRAARARLPRLQVRPLLDGAADVRRRHLALDAAARHPALHDGHLDDHRLVGRAHARDELAADGGHDERS